ncbi:MAG: TRAP transporter substrate-binding protein [Curvibacter sp.]|nr:TRAP transporter substrate-binding protein [Curvibacter sp.]
MPIIPKDVTTKGPPVSDGIQRRQVLLALAVPALGAVEARAASALKCSGAYGESVFHTQNLRTFVTQAVDLAHGALQIEVTANSQLKPMTAVLPALSSGELAFGEVVMSAYGSQYPLLSLDSLPFIVRGYEDAAVLWDSSRQLIGEEMLHHGIRVLYAVPWPGQGLFCRSPVNQLGDLKGQRLRVYNDTTRRLAELSGAVAATIEAADLPRAIDAGQVDAMLTSSPTGVDSQAWKSMKYFIDLRAWIPKNMVCVSDKVWQGLSADAQQALLGAAKEAETRGWQMSRVADEMAKKQLAEQKMQVLPPSAELRRTLDNLGEHFGREWSHKAGVGGTQALLAFYSRRQ